MDITAQMQAVIDKEAIRDCVARLARGEDRRQAEVLSACFWPDSTFDYAMYKGTFPEYLAWVTPGADAITNTQHMLGQTVIDLDGDRAKAETYVISYHRVDMGEGAGERDTCIGGRYLDTMEKRANGHGGHTWAIAHRTMLYDWYQDWGQAVDWSQGIMGYPFHGPNYTGRVKDDASVAFFAGKPF